MKVDNGNPKHWLLLAQQGLCTLLAILIRPFRKKPAKPVVLLYGHQLSGNLKALYTQWERTHRDNFDFHYLSLDPEYGEQLRQDGINVLQCNRPRDMLTLTRASAIITDHGLHLMQPLVRFTDIVFIDVWHGIPFKGFVPTDFRLQHRYDEVWVSSELLRKLYAEKFGFDATRVKALGYARTDSLFSGEPPPAELRQRIGVAEGRSIVLYAPTWKQDDSGRELFPYGESGETFISALEAVCQKSHATLVIRSHLNANIAQTDKGGVRYCPQKDFPDTEELLIISDVLICDWSSIAFDYLALDRPTLFLDVEPPFKNGFSLGVEYRFGKVVTNMKALTQSLEDALLKPTEYRQELQDKHDAIADEVYDLRITGKSGERQLERLEEILTGKDQ